jgi:uncharacterized membrane protein YdbT with pleckstrin-like domain
LVSGKSLVAYVRAGIGTVIAFLFWATASGVALNFGQNVVAAIGMAICLLVLARGAYKFLYLASIKWIIGEEEVRITEGVLPWAKRDFNHPYETIFEAFYNFGFFAKLFGYGTLVIRRTEGVTTAESESHMQTPGQVTSLINSKIKELRKAQKQPTISLAAGRRSQVEELAALASMRASGDINDEDYEVMKQRVISGESGGQPASVLLPEASGGAPS